MGEEWRGDVTWEEEGRADARGVVPDPHNHQ